MTKMTIAQLREKAVYQLAERKANNEQLLYLENDERTHNKPYTLEKAAKRDRWFERLNNIFKSEYNARLVYFGYCPTICENGTTQDLYLRHFYN